MVFAYVSAVMSQAVERGRMSRRPRSNVAQNILQNIFHIYESILTYLISETVDPIIFAQPAFEMIVPGHY